jgi:hypothetical protein
VGGRLSVKGAKEERVGTRGLFNNCLNPLKTNSQPTTKQTAQTLHHPHIHLQKTCRNLCPDLIGCVMWAPERRHFNPESSGLNSEHLHSSSPHSTRSMPSRSFIWKGGVSQFRSVSIPTDIMLEVFFAAEFGCISGRRTRSQM